MRKKTLGILFIITMLTGVFAAVPQSGGPLGSGGTIYVDDDNVSGVEDGTLANPFNTIQEGVDAASPGDTVYVFTGIYYENVNVNTTITLTGEDKETTVVNGTGGTSFTFYVPSCMIERFNITGGEDYPDAGIRLVSDENIIRECTFWGDASWGIWLDDSSHNQIYNNTILYHRYKGIFMEHSSFNKIYSNNISLNRWGIDMRPNSNNNEIFDNEFFNNYDTGWGPPCSGIVVQHSENNSYYNNIFTQNYAGFYSFYCQNLSLWGNTMNLNDYNFGIDGDDFEHFAHDITSSNTINGLPMHYLINLSDLVIDGSLEHYGYIGLVGCSNITLSNLNMRNNYEGLLVIESHGITILSSSFQDNVGGVRLESSSHSVIQGSTFTNHYHGILLAVSSNNTITNNYIANSTDGILCGGSNDNDISGNHMFSNKYGIRFTVSKRNNIKDNIVNSNLYGGFHLSRSSGNTFTDNIISNNYDGVYLYEASNDNMFVGNTISSNSNYGLTIWDYSYYDCIDNIIYHNYFINNTNQANDRCSNQWDNGYPSAGNFWSDYGGVDNFSGPYQDIPGSDGIGDTNYTIPGSSNVDNYPLVDEYGGVFNPLEELEDTDGYFQDLPDEWLKNGNPKKAFHNQIESVYKQIENEVYKGAIKHLEEIRDNKVAGWIVSDEPGAQVAKEELAEMINDVIAYLETFL